MVGRDQQRLAETQSLLEGEGHRTEVFDLRSVDEIPRWLRDIGGSVLPLDGVVHSAGVHLMRPLRVLTARALEDVLRINITAAVGLARAYCQKGICASNGSIVYLSSVAGLTGQSGVAAYAASKSGIIGLTRALAVELAADRIRVNCVAPGLVATEMSRTLLDMLTPEQASELEKMHLLGFGNARDVASAIAFLLAGTGRWITGTVLVVDGGYTAH
jgi:NAD(P)-dependent dehydrogenase (short-subunit alcohol dehydrogenase family)